MASAAASSSVYGGIGKDGFDMKLYDRQVGVFGIEACVSTIRLVSRLEPRG